MEKTDPPESGYVHFEPAIAGTVEHRVRRLFGSVTSGFDRLGDRLWRSWTGMVTVGRAQGWRFTSVGVVVGLLVFVTVRLLVTTGLQAGLSVRIGVVTSAMLILVGLLNFLLRWYVRHRASPDDSFPLLATIVLAVVAVGVAVVAFAGLTDLFWLSGYVTPPLSAVGGPSYGAVESTYLWNLVASVPLVSIPRRFGWADPLPLTGVFAGATLLAFKVVLMPPLIRVAQAIYGFIEQRWVRDITSRSSQPAQLMAGSLDQVVTLDDPYGWRDVVRKRVLGVLGPEPFGDTSLTIVAGSLAALILLPRAGWLPAHLPAAFTGAAQHTVQALPWLLVVFLIVRWVWVIPRAGSRLLYSGMLSVGWAMLAWTTQIVCAVAALINVLVTVHFVHPDARVAAGGSRTILQVVVWDLCDALPGPDIPATLGWTRPGTLDGPVVASVELAMLLSIAALFAFPVARAVRIWSQYTNRDWDPLDSVRGPARVTARVRVNPRRVRAVTDAVGQIRAAAEALQQVLIQAPAGDPVWIRICLRHRWDLRTRLLLRWFSPPDHRIYQARAHLKRELSPLIAVRDQLVTESADSAIINTFDVARYALYRQQDYLELAPPAGREPGGYPGWLNWMLPLGFHTSAVTFSSDAYATLVARTAGSIDVFVRVASGSEPTDDTLGHWERGESTRVELAAVTRPIPEIIDRLRTPYFRDLPDAPARIRTVLSAVARRPVDDVANAANHLFAPRPPRQGPAPQWPKHWTATPQGTAVRTSLIDPDARILAGLPAQAGGFLLREAARRPATDLAAIVGLLDPQPLAVFTQFAALLPPRDLVQLTHQIITSEDAALIDATLKDIAEYTSVEAIVELLLALREAGHDTEVQRLLTLAGTWGSVTSKQPFFGSVFVRYDERGNDLIALTAALRDLHQTDELTTLFSAHAERSPQLRRALERELRLTTFPQEQWRTWLHE